LRITTTAVSILVILISALSALGSDAEIRKDGYATILIYHKFDEPKSPSTSISSDTFIKHLDFLKENSYSVISIEELLSLMRSRSPIPPKTVVITIDDGYRSTYTVAYPILRKYGYPFTVFLYMEGVGRFPDYLTREQIEEMREDPLVTFGNHSYSHGRLARKGSDLSDNEYLQVLKNDLVRSEKRFAELVGHRPFIYSYPYGEYNRSMMQVLKDNHYIGAFTQDTGSLNNSFNPLLIPRDPLVGGWAELKKLREFLETEPLYLKEHSPDFGLLSSPEIERIEVIVEGLDRYRNMGIYISEFGWRRPVIEPSEGRIVLDGPFRITRPVNRVAITGVDSRTGRKATFFYMIIHP